jgi:phosphotransferase system enzyme I (PtsP)
MEDIGRRLLESLENGESHQEEMQDSRILVSTDILPSDLATLDMEKILGIITEKGDLNSHAAIMARSLGIPAIVGIDGLIRQIGLHDELIVDGNIGHVYINPHKRIRSEYERLQRDYSLKMKGLESLRTAPAVTTDGVRVFLRANIGLVSDIRVASASGAEGVGLYRTEFPFMARKAFPDRHEQAAIYRKILEGFAGQPVTIRTLDIGGDKGLPYFHHPLEENPFMGWRAIRISLDCLDIFRDQLAAILMTSSDTMVRIMFPMVSGIEEIRAIKQVTAEVMADLQQAGIPFNPHVPLGIMVETPAAVLTAEILAREVDFFSIGTNDLIQYTLAADRNNPRVKSYYSQYHPAVIHSIHKVAQAANANNIPVSICGEMAADPASAILLLGLGITDLSMASPSIPLNKQAIRTVSAEYARQIAAKVLDMKSSTEIRDYMKTIGLELGIIS